MNAPAQLPIEEARGSYEAALRGPRAVVVTAPTGSGKSTRLPGWTADALGGPVLVVEPRRVACRALAVHLARELGQAVGERVGYRVRFEDRLGPRTQVAFVTPGVALNLVASGGIEAYAAVLVDEFHERSWEIELLVALLRRPGRDGAPKLILCSATLAAASLTEALDAALVEARGRSFPVEVEHRGGESGEGPSERDLETRVAEVVRASLPGTSGDILVFLPGKGEIERCRRALADDGGLELVPVHGGVPPGTLVDAFAARREGAPRRVYLATNVAESSLTLPGVRLVIDSGLARMRIHRGGRSVLGLGAIARDSMEQRAGRAGRVAPGRCIRLWSRSFIPREVTAPEIERIELDDVLLRAASCGLDGGAFDEAAWLAPPPPFAVDAARERLRSVGALDADGQMTPRGRELGRLPVSASEGRMLGDPPPALAGTLADLVALLETRRGLALPAGALPGARRGAILDARRALLESLPGGRRDEVHAALVWLRNGRARVHGLNPAALAEARRLADALRRLVGAPKLAVDSGAEDFALPPREALVAHLLARLPEAAFVARRGASEGGDRGRRGRGRPAAWANGTIELGVYPASLDLDEDRRDPPPRAGLILEHEWIGTGRHTRGSGRMILPCRPAELAAAELGTLEVAEPSIDRDSGALVAAVERRYAGVVLERQTRALAGAPLRGALAQLILEGRRIPRLPAPAAQLREALRDGLHRWGVMSQVEGVAEGLLRPSEWAELGHGASIGVGERAWLEAQLEALGLEGMDELELLSSEDLRPDLGAIEAALRNLGRRELSPESLAEDFPRTVVDRDAVYGCTVELGRRRVVLRPADAKAKKRGEPKASVLPRFRGFGVLFVQASRRQKLR